MLANVLNCDFIVNEFKLQSCNYVHFRKNTSGTGKHTLIAEAIGEIVSLMFFHKYGFAIK